MYCLSLAGGPTMTAAKIREKVEDRLIHRSVGDQTGIRHLDAIDRICERGITYSNEDFDVLSAAYRWATS